MCVHTGSTENVFVDKCDIFTFQKDFYSLQLIRPLISYKDETVWKEIEILFRTFEIMVEWRFHKFIL